MKRLFECRKCHHKFEVDEKSSSDSYIVCPNCKSDDIDYARNSSHGKVLLWCAIATVAAGLIFFAFKGCREETAKGASSTDEEVAPLEELTTPLDSDSVYVDPQEIVGLTVPPKVDITGGKPSFKNGGYTFSVSVKDAPEGRKYYIAVLQCDDHNKEVARCDENLHFEMVPPCESGEYDLAVIEEGTKKLLGFSTRSGFVTVQGVAKLSPQDLQKLIDSSDDALMGGNEQIAPDCKLHFEGVTDGDVPTSMFDLTMKLEDGVWKAVKVKKVNYDEMNRVSDVYLSVEY